MSIDLDTPRKTDRRTVSLRPDVLVRLEPLPDPQENLRWANRNAHALAAHGHAITATGLAGAEFERV